MWRLQLPEIDRATGQTMKNSNTAACAVFSFLVLLPFTAQSAAAIPPPSMESRQTGKTQCVFLPNAPDQHLVVKRDTLWDIAGKFLEHPWCWPQVWGMNRDQIRDPHWIYPGQTVYFNRAAGRLQLTPPGQEAGPDNTVRLQPQIRSSAAQSEAIPTISAEQIAPFLARPLIVTEEQFKGAPVIMATPEGHVYLSRNDFAYVRGALEGAVDFHVFRAGQPLRDPESKLVLGYEAKYLGMAHLERAATNADEAHRFIITESREEIGVHDRLLPLMPPGPNNYVPHAPAQTIDARVVAIYGGGSQGGQYQVISINRGTQHGVDVGAALKLQRRGPTVPDVTNERKPVKLPDLQYGTLLIFRVFDTLSYGLIMQVSDAVHIGDIAKSP